MIFPYLCNHKSSERHGKTIQYDRQRHYMVNIDDKLAQIEAGREHTARGALQTQPKTDTDGVATVPLPQVKGIYLLSVGKQMFKVIRQ
ncbi:MAG: hypothetical protein MJZ33_13955 [Paludibacteraceae bacterium]|nr:hypothetical protein [Paludibacteraceae bacterium]